jgi:hypothetical protein
MGSFLNSKLPVTNEVSELGQAGGALAKNGQGIKGVAA